jgi:uncharacterized membrane protein YbjE (DUF340 family)
MNGKSLNHFFFMRKSHQFLICLRPQDAVESVSRSVAPIVRGTTLIISQSLFFQSSLVIQIYLPLCVLTSVFFSVCNQKPIEVFTCQRILSAYFKRQRKSVSNSHSFSVLQHHNCRCLCLFFPSLELHEYKLSLHTKGGIIKV